MVSPVHILLIEDNPDDVILLRAMLSDQVLVEDDMRPLELTLAESLTRGLETIDKQEIDIVLLDLGLPESYGTETLEKFTAVAHHPPVIVLTGLDDDHIALSSIRGGAMDYLVKGQFTEDFLQRSIQYAFERRSFLRILEAREREIRSIANNVPAAVVHLDGQGRYLFVNRVFEQWLQLPSNEIMGRHFRDILGEDTYLRIKDHVEQALSGHEVTFEDQRSFVDGSTRWLSESLCPRIRFVRLGDRFIRPDKRYFLQETCRGYRPIQPRTAAARSTKSIRLSTPTSTWTKFSPSPSIRFQTSSAAIHSLSRRRKMTSLRSPLARDLSNPRM